MVDESKAEDQEKKESTTLQLTPELRELAQVAARCLHEYERHQGNGLPRQVLRVHDKIATFGSLRLKEFWDAKAKSQSISKQGYICAVPKHQLGIFRQYRNQLLSTMGAESNAEVHNVNVRGGKDDDAKPAGVFGDGEVEMYIDSSKQKKESTSWQLWPEFRVPSSKIALFRQHRSVLLDKMDTKSKAEVLGSQLTPELRELARIGADCLYERPVGNVDGVPKHVIHDRISTFGSPSLRQFWQEKSNLPSVSERGYTLAVPTSKIALFRQYRSELLAMMVAESKVKVQNQNVGECNVDEKQSTGSQLTPELRELAQIGANCLYERPAGNVGGVQTHVIHDRITTLGSEKLKQLWQKKSKLPSFAHHGYTLAVPSTKMALFRQYRSELLAKMVSEGNLVVDLHRSKIEDEGRLSANPSLPDASPVTRLPPDLEELARLVTECMDANSNKICQETLALRVLSSECQMLKDRWNGMARLSRFQRDGYSMLIPRFMREAFQIHLISGLNSGTKGQSMETSGEKQNSNLTCQLKKPPPDATSRPQKKPNQFAERATIPELSVTTKSQTADDLADVVQSMDTSCRNFTDFPADDDAVLEAAEAAARKRHSTAFSNEHRSEEVPSMKRLKAAFGTVPSKSIKECKRGISLSFKWRSIEECKHDIRVFFKWRHRRLDLAHEQFLDESKPGCQVRTVDRARSNLKAHHAVELDKLTELKECCCANFQVGSSHRLLVESFVELAAMHWKDFFHQVVNAWGSFGNQDCAEISERKERDRYRLFLDAEKACVQRHLELLSSG